MRKTMLAGIFSFLMMLPFMVIAQGKVITGKVTDAKDGSPIIGASVVAKGTKQGVATGADGKFTITVPQGVTKIVITSVGFQNEEINISGISAVDITLNAAQGSMNEVVVIGYGTQRKKDLTGAVTSVASKDFQRGQITTPDQLIAGKVAGVNITSNGGAPGAGSTIRIRGGASLNASNDPLIVVDGVPLENGNVAGAPSALSMINPNDIESFNILKDASATAIYGSRASNGVIIITTKKGKGGAPKFNFTSNTSLQTPAKKVDVLSADEFRKVVNEKGTDAQKALLGTANTNWQDEIYHNAMAFDNNLSVSGSLKNLPYRVSVGYLWQDGILKTDNMKRFTGAVNLSPRLLDNHLKIDINLKGSTSKNRYANRGAIGSAIVFDPTQPVNVTNKYGNYFEWLDPATTEPNTLAPRNPVGLLELREDNSDVWRSIGNVQFDYKMHFLPELRANLNLGYDVSNGEGTIYVPDFAAQQYFRKGSNNQYKQEKSNKLLEFYLNYAKDLTSINSRIDLMAGYGYQDFKTTSYYYADYRADGTMVPNTEPNFEKDVPQNTLISYYGRLNYSWANRLLFTATVRRDGSSRFNEDNRWGVFPSAALAWNIYNESFMKDVKAMSALKLRLGWGVTGQQDIGLNYGYLPIYALSNDNATYQFGSNYYNMYRPSAYDANLKWEETQTFNIGLDWGFLDNRITGSLDYYDKKTEDLLNTIPIPVGSNFSNELLTNVGTIRNNGVEFSINAQPIKKNNMVWDLGFNITYNNNEITNLTKVEDPNYKGVLTGGISGGTGNQMQIHSVGYNTFSFYGFKQVYNQDGTPVEGLYEDLNKDGIINDNDRYRYKSSQPKVFLGFSTNFDWNKWNAGFVLRANIDNYVYNNVNSQYGVYRAILFNQNYLANAVTDVYNTNFDNNRYLSDYYVENASFLRMDNLYVGYNLGQLWKNSNLRINFNVQNVFTITKYSGLDPEIPGGIDNNFYPRPRTFTLGFGLDF